MAWKKVLQQMGVNASDLADGWSPNSQLLAVSGDNLKWGDPTVTGGEIAMSRIPYVNNEVYFPYIDFDSYSTLQQEKDTTLPAYGGVVARLISFRGDADLLSDATASFRADLVRFTGLDHLNDPEGVNLPGPYFVIVYHNQTGIDPNNIYVNITGVGSSTANGRWISESSHMSEDDTEYLTAGEISSGHGTLRLYSTDNSMDVLSETEAVKNLTSVNWAQSTFDVDSKIEDVQDQDLVIAYVHWKHAEGSSGNSFGFKRHPIVPYTTLDTGFDVNNFADNDSAVCLGLSIPGTSGESVGGGLIWDFNHEDRHPSIAHGSYTGVFASEHIGTDDAKLSIGEIAETGAGKLEVQAGFTADDGTYSNLMPTTDGGGQGFEATITVLSNVATVEIICTGTDYAVDDVLTFDSSGFTNANGDLEFDVKAVDSLKYECAQYVIRVYRNSLDVSTRDSLNVQYVEDTNINLLGSSALTTANFGSATASVRLGFYLVNNIPINLVGDVGVGTYANWEMFTDARGGKLSAKLPQALGTLSNTTEFNQLKLGASTSTGTALRLYAGNKISFSGGGSPAGPYISRPSSGLLQISSADIIELDTGKTTGHVHEVSGSGPPNDWNSGTAAPFVHQSQNTGVNFAGTINVANNIPDITSMIITNTGIGYTVDTVKIKASDNTGTPWEIDIDAIISRGKGALELSGAIGFSEPTGVNDGTAGTNSDVDHGIRLGTQTDISSVNYGDKYIQVKDTSTGDVWKNIEDLSAAGPVTAHTAMAARKIVGNTQDVAAIPQEVDIVRTISDNDDTIPTASAVAAHYDSTDVNILGGKVSVQNLVAKVTSNEAGFGLNEWLNPLSEYNASTNTWGLHPAEPGSIRWSPWAGKFFLYGIGNPIVNHFSPDHQANISGGVIGGVAIGGRFKAKGAIVFDTGSGNLRPWVVDGVTGVTGLATTVSSEQSGGSVVCTTSAASGEGEGLEVEISLDSSGDATGGIQLIEPGHYYEAGAVVITASETGGTGEFTFTVSSIGTDSFLLTDENDNELTYKCTKDVNSGIRNADSSIAVKERIDGQLTTYEIQQAINRYAFDNETDTTTGNWTNGTYDEVAGVGGSGTGIEATIVITSLTTANVNITDIGDNDYRVDDNIVFTDPLGSETVTVTLRDYGHNGTFLAVDSITPSYGVHCNIMSEIVGNTNLAISEGTDVSGAWKVSAFQGGESGHTDIGSDDTDAKVRIFGTQTGINLTSDTASSSNAGDITVTDANIIGKLTAGNADIGSISSGNPCQIYGTKTGINLVSDTPGDATPGQFKAGAAVINSGTMAFQGGADLKMYLSSDNDYFTKITQVGPAGTRWYKIPDHNALDTNTDVSPAFDEKYFALTDNADGSVTTSGGDITTDTAWATKGDLIIGTGSDTASVLTVGGITNGHVLTANSSEGTHGLNWAAPALPATLTADLAAGDFDISGLANVTFTDEVDNTVAGATDIDWTDGQKQNATVTGTDHDLTFIDPAGPCNLLLKVIQGDGNDTVDWPVSVKWPDDGTAPTLSTGNGEIDIITFYFDGTNYFGVASLDFAS